MEPMDSAEARQERVLVFAPRGRDAELTGRVLRGLTSVELCRTSEEFLRELAAGVGVVLIAEEALTPGLLEALASGLASQEAWSDVPFVVLAGAKLRSEYWTLRTGPEVLSRLEALGNVVTLERPVRMRTLVGVVRVALESRKRQYLMRVLHQNLESLNRGKDEFLAMLGHELRNPLGAARTALTLLQGGHSDERGRARYLEILGRQMSAMTRMLDDILDVSRLSLGKLQLEGQDLELGQLVRRSVDLLQPTALLARHTLTLELGEGPFLVRGDAIRFEQIIANVVGNALKYTPPGGRIQVSVQRDDVDVVIWVRDNGIGISLEMLPKVFELFTQARNGTERAQGGLGVGLALVDTLVRMHGGKVELTSEGQGKGSQFQIRIPLVAPGKAAAATPTRRDRPSRSLHVLLVEDNPDGREVLREALEDSGHRVDVAVNGEDGISQATRAPPDVLLTDLGLPGLDGYEVARRVRAACSPVPYLVALTGYGMPEDRRRTREAGFDDHLVKPLNFELLDRIFEHAVGRNASTRGEAGASARGP
ncbi:MAG TPA: ATP-binding protein [Myxococcaceae bacterium]|nr:ATP-binding protein [Myxococcaceae bacterium]